MSPYYRRYSGPSTGHTEEYNAADPITNGVEHSQTLPHRVIDGHQLLGVGGATGCEIKGLELIMSFLGHLH